jgi:hypothetical protein
MRTIKAYENRTCSLKLNANASRMMSTVMHERVYKLWSLPDGLLDANLRRSLAGILVHCFSCAYTATALFSRLQPTVIFASAKEQILKFDTETKAETVFAEKCEGYYFPHAIALSAAEDKLFLGDYYFKMNQSFPLYCADVATMKLVWTQKMFKKVGSLCAFEDKLIATIYQSPLLILEQATGNQLHSFAKSENYIYGVAFVAGLLFVFSAFITI